jgi:hypothetical protein
MPVRRRAAIGSVNASHHNGAKRSNTPVCRGWTLITKSFPQGFPQFL